MSLQTGDVVLVTGTHASSRRLVAVQKRLSPDASSSHVMVAQSETLLVDARPKHGVQHHFLIDGLKNIEPGWVALRRRGLSETDRDRIIKACAFYLYQSYLIHPTKKIGNTKSYCSELARKIFDRAAITTGLPATSIVMPAHFDEFRAGNELWENVTDEVRQWVQTVQSDEVPHRAICQSIVSGIKNNRKRYDDRKRHKKNLNKMFKKGKISRSKLHELLSVISATEKEMEFRFWDIE